MIPPFKTYEGNYHIYFNRYFFAQKRRKYAPDHDLRLRPRKIQKYLCHWKLYLLFIHASRKFQKYGPLRALATSDYLYTHLVVSPLPQASRSLPSKNLKSHAEHKPISTVAQLAILINLSL